MRKMVIVLSIVALSTSSWAKECSLKSVDYRDQMPDIRDQDSIGWCYAHTAADLLTQYLGKSDPKYKDDPVSGTSVAISYNSKYKKKYYKNKEEGEAPVAEGGYTEKALLASLDSSFCLESQMPSNDFSFVPLNESCKQIESGNCDLSKLLSSLYKYEDDSSECHPSVLSAQALFPNLGPDEVVRILQKTHKNNVLKKLEQKNCQEHAPANLRPKVINQEIDQAGLCATKVNNLCPFAEHNEALFTAMDGALDNGSIVGISYYSNFLKTDDYTHPNSGGHASSIIGRKVDPETCEVKYILRNSWGQGCYHYYKNNPQKLSCIGAIPFSDAAQKEEALRLKREELAAEELDVYKERLTESIKALEAQAVITEAQRLQQIENCRAQYPEQMANPQVECQEDGYLLVSKSELKKNLIGVDYLE